MVPMNQPEAALKMLRQFVEAGPLLEEKKAPEADLIETLLQA